MPTAHHIYKALECAYYIGGIAIAIFAGFGLRQLSLAKQSLSQNAELAKISAKREAYRLAAEQCEVYLMQIIPKQDECYEHLGKPALDYLHSYSVKVGAKQITIKPPKNSSSEIKKKLIEVIRSPHVVPMANSMEAFAVLFTSGVAAEGVAFKSVGITFCDTMETFAPVLVSLGGYEYFQNLLALFLLWQNRINQEKLTKQHKDIEEQLSKTQTIGVKPIGT